jgi:uncharacterized protein YacL
MNCYTSAVLGLAMLGASFLTLTSNEEQHYKLKLSFPSSNLDKIYTGIVIERRNIFIQGLILGLVISYFTSNLFEQKNNFHKITFFLAVTLMVSVVYYFLIPKSDYMLNYLKTEEEIKAWLEIYKYMKLKYFLGFLFGFLSAIPIAYSMC